MYYGTTGHTRAAVDSTKYVELLWPQEEVDMESLSVIYAYVVNVSYVCLDCNLTPRADNK